MEKGSPLYVQQQQHQGPPRRIKLGEVTVDESSTDPLPPPAPAETPIVPPRPSKSSASSSLASTPGESKDGDSDDDEEEEENQGGAGASGVPSLSSQLWGPERRVEVRRVPRQGLGISIVGGKIDPPPGSGHTTAVTGIFIKNVLEGSPAGRAGLLRTGDRILEVDGTDLRSAAHDEAVDVIRQSGNVVTFVVQSLLSVATAQSEGRREAGLVRT